VVATSAVQVSGEQSADALRVGGAGDRQRRPVRAQDAVEVAQPDTGLNLGDLPVESLGVVAHRHPVDPVEAEQHPSVSGASLELCPAPTARSRVASRTRRRTSSSSRGWAKRSGRQVNRRFQSVQQARRQRPSCSTRLPPVSRNTVLLARLIRR
jgi:hypothetical protein